MNLHIAQLQHTVSTLASLSFPFFVIDENLQQGNTFGQRLSHAFLSVFAKGYERVIAIGSDCAELTPEQIIKAQEYLQKDICVTGPDHRGGIFLLGLTATSFDSASIENVGWNSRVLQSDLENYFITIGQPHYKLVTLNDINKAEDILRCGKTKPCRFVLLLSHILQQLHTSPLIFCYRILKQILNKQSILRGPPSFAFS